MAFSCHLFLGVLIISATFSDGANITCYQCVRYANERCNNDSLLPCPSYSDRCVTHVSKDEKKGFVIKRECGLGPCGFEDDMVNKGLGMSRCDRSKFEYFCVTCCRTNGCNNGGESLSIPIFLLALQFLVMYLNFLCRSGIAIIEVPLYSRRF